MADEPEFPPPPRTTARLVGHGAAEQTLRQAWTGGRMAHAWLLAGPRGIGKATLAYRFARTVLAGQGGGGLFGEDEPLWEVPPEHPVFRRIAARAHPDLAVIERQRGPKQGDRLREEIIVEHARGAVEFFSLTSAEGGWRVVIVDAADELNRSAANALLKAIEEPPERGLVLAVTHRPGLVLPTIRSRCRMLRMGRLTDAEVRQILSQHWPELPPETAAGLVAMAEGSPGRAVTLGEADGFGFYAELSSLLGKMPDLDARAMHRIADRLARRDLGAGFTALVELPAWWVSRLIRTAIGNPPAEVMAGETEAFQRVLPRRSLEQWVAVWEKVSLLAAQAVARNLDRGPVALAMLSTVGRVRPA